jgi:hypothetical protein
LKLLLSLLCLSLVALPTHAQDTTPYNCERLTIAKTGSWAAPIIRDLCEKQEARNGQSIAKILGKPRPSISVYELPAFGSAEAKRTGLACVGGTAMQRLNNGWEQLRDHQHNWLRCRDL